MYDVQIQTLLHTFPEEEKLDERARIHCCGNDQQLWLREDCGSEKMQWRAEACSRVSVVVSMSTSSSACESVEVVMPSLVASAVHIGLKDQIPEH